LALPHPHIIEYKLVAESMRKGDLGMVESTKVGPGNQAERPGKGKKTGRKRPVPDQPGPETKSWVSRREGKRWIQCLKFSRDERAHKWDKERFTSWCMAHFGGGYSFGLFSQQGKKQVHHWTCDLVGDSEPSDELLAIIEHEQRKKGGGSGFEDKIEEFMEQAAYQKLQMAQEFSQILMANTAKQLADVVNQAFEKDDESSELAALREELAALREEVKNKPANNGEGDKLRPGGIEGMMQDLEEAQKLKQALEQYSRRLGAVTGDGAWKEDAVGLLRELLGDLKASYGPGQQVVQVEKKGIQNIKLGVDLDG